MEDNKEEIFESAISNIVMQNKVENSKDTISNSSGSEKIDKDDIREEKEYKEINSEIKSNRSSGEFNESENQKSESQKQSLQLLKDKIKSREQSENKIKDSLKTKKFVFSNKKKDKAHGIKEENKDTIEDNYKKNADKINKEIKENDDDIKKEINSERKESEVISNNEDKIIYSKEENVEDNDKKIDNKCEDKIHACNHLNNDVEFNKSNHNNSKDNKIINSKEDTEISEERNPELNENSNTSKNNNNTSNDNLGEKENVNNKDKKVIKSDEETQISTNDNNESLHSKEKTKELELEKKVEDEIKSNSKSKDIKFYKEVKHNLDQIFDNKESNKDPTKPMISKKEIINTTDSIDHISKNNIFSNNPTSKDSTDIKENHVENKNKANDNENTNKNEIKYPSLTDFDTNHKKTKNNDDFKNNTNTNNTNSKENKASMNNIIKRNKFLSNHDNNPQIKKENKTLIENDNSINIISQKNKINNKKMSEKLDISNEDKNYIRKHHQVNNKKDFTVITNKDEKREEVNKYSFTNQSILKKKENSRGILNDNFNNNNNNNNVYRNPSSHNNNNNNNNTNYTNSNTNINEQEDDFNLYTSKINLGNKNKENFYTNLESKDPNQNDLFKVPNKVHTNNHDYYNNQNNYNKNEILNRLDDEDDSVRIINVDDNIQRNNKFLTNQTPRNNNNNTYKKNSNNNINNTNNINNKDKLFQEQQVYKKEQEQEQEYYSSSPKKPILIKQTTNKTIIDNTKDNEDQIKEDDGYNTNNQSIENNQYNKKKSIDSYNQVYMKKKQMNTVPSTLIVKQHQIVKELLTSYILYSISQISNKESLNSKTEEIHLCKRRFSQFYAFHQYISVTYPFYLIPKLSERSIKVKFFDDNDFLESRRQQLSFYLNYYTNHSELSTIKDFHKFLTEPNFDYNYFSTPRKPISFPVTDEVNNSSISKQLKNVLANFTTKSNIKKLKDVGSMIGIKESNSNFEIKFKTNSNISKEAQIGQYEEYFTLLLENLNNYKQEVFQVIDSTKEMSENRDLMSYCFSYMKDLKLDVIPNNNNDLNNYNKPGISNNINPINPKDSSYKNYSTNEFSVVFDETANIVITTNSEEKSTELFDECSKLEKEICKKYKSLYNNDGISLKSEIDGYISIITGIINLINRYNDYLVEFNTVKTINNGTNTISLDGMKRNSLSKELENAKNFKVIYEDKILNEIEYFKEEYKDGFYNIQKNFVDFMKNENKFEFFSLKETSFIKTN